MGLFDVVCTESTLVSFLSKLKSRLIQVQLEPKTQIALDWYHLLSKRSDLSLDITPERYEEVFREEELFRFLEKSSQGGGSKIRISPGISKESHELCNDFLSAIYLMEDDTDNLSATYGRLFLSSTNMLDIGGLLFNDNKFIVDKKQASISMSSWDEIKQASLPVTDVVIIDNYLIEEKTESATNISALIRNLIPQEQKCKEIRIAILTGLFKDPQPKIEIKLSNWFDVVSRELGRAFRSVRIDLSIGVIDRIDLNHDRSVLTNYHWLDSGNGFKVFGQNGSPKVSTTKKQSTIFSKKGTLSTSASSFDCWFLLRSHAQHLFKNACSVKGDFTNNLLLRS